LFSAALVSFLPAQGSLPRHTELAFVPPPAYGAQILPSMKLRGGEDSSETVLFYEDILEDDPGSSTAHVNLGRVYERRNDLPAAERHYNIAKTLAPTDPHPYSYLGQILMNHHNDLEAALEEFTRAVALRPEDPDLHHVLARINHGLGRHEEAKRGYQETLRLQPNDGQTMSDLGSLLEGEAGDEDTVLGLYKQATKFHPDSASAWSNHGAALLKREKYTDAIASFRKALDIEPDFHFALCNLGNALSVIAPESAEIEDIYMRAVDVCPFDPVTLVNYGKICLEKNKVKEAEDVFEEAVKLQPDMVEAISGLGNVIEKRLNDNLDIKRKKQFLEIARLHHEKAMSLLPDNNDVIVNYATFLQTHEAKRHEEAEELFKTVLSRDPQHACALCNLAGLHYIKGRREEAMALYERAFLLQPRRSEVADMLSEFPESKLYHHVR